MFGSQSFEQALQASGNYRQWMLSPEQKLNLRIQQQIDGYVQDIKHFERNNDHLIDKLIERKVNKDKTLLKKGQPIMNRKEMVLKLQSQLMLPKSYRTAITQISSIQQQRRRSRARQSEQQNQQYFPDLYQESQQESTKQNKQQQNQFARNPFILNQALKIFDEQQMKHFENSPYEDFKESLNKNDEQVLSKEILEPMKPVKLYYTPEKPVEQPIIKVDKEIQRDEETIDNADKAEQAEVEKKTESVQVATLKKKSLKLLEQQNDIFNIEINKKETDKNNNDKNQERRKLRRPVTGKFVIMDIEDYQNFKLRKEKLEKLKAGDNNLEYQDGRKRDFSQNVYKDELQKSKINKDSKDEMIDDEDYKQKGKKHSIIIKKGGKKQKLKKRKNTHNNTTTSIMRTQNSQLSKSYNKQQSLQFQQSFKDDNYRNQQYSQSPKNNFYKPSKINRPFTANYNIGAFKKKRGSTTVVFENSQKDIRNSSNKQISQNQNYQNELSSTQKLTNQSNNNKVRQIASKKISVTGNTYDNRNDNIIAEISTINIQVNNNEVSDTNKIKCSSKGFSIDNLDYNDQKAGTPHADLSHHIETFDVKDIETMIDELEDNVNNLVKSDKQKQLRGNLKPHIQNIYSSYWNKHPPKFIKQSTEILRRKEKQ